MNGFGNFKIQQNSVLVSVKEGTFKKKKRRLQEILYVQCFAYKCVTEEVTGNGVHEACQKLTPLTQLSQGHASILHSLGQWNTRAN